MVIKIESSLYLFFLFLLFCLHTTPLHYITPFAHPAEYSLVNKGKELLIAASTLTDAAIDKAIELNAEYQVVDLVKDKVQTAMKSGSSQN